MTNTNNTITEEPLVVGKSDTTNQLAVINAAFTEICCLESNQREYSLTIADKVIYEQKDNGDIIKKMYEPTTESMWTVDKLNEFDFVEIKQVAMELTMAQSYGVTNDKAFSYQKIQPLLTDKLTEKEKYAYIQATRDAVIIDWSYEGKGSKYINDYKEELYATLKSKVIEGHTYYQIGEEMEIMIAGVPDPHNEYTLTTFDSTGPLTDYEFGTAEDVTDFLMERHAVACNKEAMSQVLSFAMPDSGNDGGKHQQYLINNEVMRQTFEAKKGHPMTRK